MKEESQLEVLLGMSGMSDQVAGMQSTYAEIYMDHRGTSHYTY